MKENPLTNKSNFSCRLVHAASGVLKNLQPIVIREVS